MMRQSQPGETKDDQLTEALAVLISSTRSKKRSLSLPEIAKWLSVALEKLGSYSAVAQRVGVSAKMLRQFSYVHRLSRPVKRLFEERALDSVDALAHLVMLTEKDQEPVARSLAAGLINTNDVRAIVELRQKDKRHSIKTLMDEVSSSRATKEYVVEFVVRGARDARALRAVITEYIPQEEILRLEITGLIGRLTLSSSGRARLGRVAKQLGTTLQNVMPAILAGPGPS